MPGNRKWSYAILGSALAWGAPLGLGILHMVQEGAPFTRAWATTELTTRAGDYIYLTVTSLLAFVFFGWFTGKGDDRVRAGALTDPLTGLWNRRYLDDRLRRELARSARHGAPLSLLLIDLDHLKEINDQGGHGAGDEALKFIADSIRSSARSSDVVARYGGDEFAVLAPSTQAPEAVTLAERIRAAVEQGHAGARRTTVSIGISDVAQNRAFESRELIQAADRALYRAKSGGRNRIVRDERD